MIGNSIKSVLNQTYKNLEIIVVDDGSTDNTKVVVDKIKDSRIKYIKLIKNTGGSNARNVGILNAKGKYISFQDSDDIYYPDKLETQLKNIINKKTDLDFCKIKVAFKNSYLFFPNNMQEKSISKAFTNFFGYLEILSFDLCNSTRTFLVYDILTLGIILNIKS